MELLESTACVTSVSQRRLHVLASGVVAVKLPWLPRVAALVTGADGDSSDGAPLPATAVQEICSPSAPITGPVIAAIPISDMKGCPKKMSNRD